jgi:hypothetical protein
MDLVCQISLSVVGIGNASAPACGNVVKVAACVDGPPQMLHNRANSKQQPERKKMSAEKNKNIAREYIEQVWNGRRAGMIEQYMAEDAVTSSSDADAAPYASEIENRQ